MLRHYIAAGLALSLSALAVQAQQPQRPLFELDSSFPYNLDAIPAYAGEHPDVYGYIDDHVDEHLAALQRWLRQPSISAQDVGIDDMAQMLVDDFRDLGFAEAELVPTDGHPGVWGYYDAGAEKTLMVYMMYDVQPVNPDDWRSPPFAAELVEHSAGTALMARGATNQKGPQRAFLNALEAIIAVDGELPVNLMITAEGEEELGSPHYPQIVDRYEERLRTADGVIFPMNQQAPNGAMNIFLGVKGIVYWELEARGGEWGGPVTSEIHGSYKAVLDSPVWRLIQVLSLMTTPDGNTALVPGFYDGIRPPTETDGGRLRTGRRVRSPAISGWPADGRAGRGTHLSLGGRQGGWWRTRRRSPPQRRPLVTLEGRVSPQTGRGALGTGRRGQI